MSSSLRRFSSTPVMRVSARVRPTGGAGAGAGADDGEFAGEIVSGAAEAAVTPLGPGGEIFEAVAARLGTPMTNVGKGYVGALKSQNQQTENRCVATAVCTAMRLRAFMMADAKTLEVLRPPDNAPSVAHAYYAQRRMECMATARCDCGPVCGGLCDAKCGSLLSVVVAVAKQGIVLERTWPVSASRSTAHIEASIAEGYLSDKAHYRLTRKEMVDLGLKASAIAAKVTYLLDSGIPVVCNLFLYPNQEAWSKTQRKVVLAKSVYDSVHTLPRGEGMRLPMGHCVLIVGYDAAKRRYRLRNSFGESWGWNGDFAMKFEDLTERHAHGLMAVLEVALENIDKV